MRTIQAKYNYAQRADHISVIMPVYNEISTIKDAIKSFQDAYKLDNRLELIIVESASNDGSREYVTKFQNEKGILVILEERPFGKGHAVRNGISHAKGDIISIFDADGEYVFSDIWKLVDAIEDGRASFVLGSRHGPGQKVRQFGKHNWLAQSMNLMHWIFATMINLAFDVRIRDPFTMWKVFRREILDHLELVSDRFDLDWEIICKFAILGFVPLEIPINYISRDYSQGKKVKLISDPISWIVLLLKLRFSQATKELRSTRI